MEDIRLLNNFYISRFIDSLELDFEKWTCTYYCGMDGGWYEYESPEYVNKVGHRLTFCFRSNGTGAYINGIYSWILPWYVLIPPFTNLSRRFYKASRKMKKFVKENKDAEYRDRLMKAL